VIVDCAIYEQGERREQGPLPLEHAYEACRTKDDAFVWIGLYEPSAEEFDSLMREFGLHELAVEDAVHAHQRPKIEVYGDHLFLVLKTARYVDPEEVIELGEVQIFLGEGFIITVRHGAASDLHPVREELEQRPELLSRGPGAVVHAILDKVVDDYQPAIDGLAQDIDEVEEQVFSTDRGSPAERIYKLKREVIDFHRSTAPLVHPVDRLARGHFELIHPEVRTYFRDVTDHLLRVSEQLDSFREVLTSALTANLTQVSVRQNSDMRRISAWVAIIAVPTMVAGIYGMNFEHMPELKWELGYPGVIMVMLTACFGLYHYFRKVGWL
jgi:magnesium transporter